MREIQSSYRVPRYRYSYQNRPPITQINAELVPIPHSRTGLVGCYHANGLVRQILCANSYHSLPQIAQINADITTPCSAAKAMTARGRGGQKEFNAKSSHLCENQRNQWEIEL